jgi:hypothetical protein
MKRWNALGRTVLAGSKAFEIIVPIFARKPKDEEDEEAALIGFKAVRRIFTYSQTEGEELPPIQLPEWDLATALRTLNIRQVPFAALSGNLQGYSQGRDIAINPVAAHPEMTLFHEVGHVVLGHTTPEMIAEYEHHRGDMEFGAEGTAHLVMKELGRLTVVMASNSRAYIQDWLRGARPPDKAIRQVFAATDDILKAGRIAVGGMLHGEGNE